MGLYNYITHPQTEPLALGYAYAQDKPRPWRIIQGEPMPDDLRRGLEDPNQLLGAWNSTFERYMLWFKLKLMIPIHRFADPQASARYLSMTGDLKDDGNILGLPQDLKKHERGKELIKMFSIPTIEKANKKTKAPERIYFKDWITHPEEWEEFMEYMCQDTVAEREMGRRLNLVQAFPLPPREYQIWVFDQGCNDRGMPVDVSLVKKAYALADRAKKAAIDRQNVLTGLKNSNSNQQMLAWVRGQGYKATTLRKERVTAALKYERDKLTPLCIKVLEARRAASSTTYKKLSTILRQVSSDGRLRNLFIYYGSARCGRWSGNSTQFHNMARPDKRFEDKKNVDRARELIYAEDYDGIIREFGKKPENESDPPDFGAVLLTVKNVIRTFFVAQ